MTGPLSRGAKKLKKVGCVMCPKVYQEAGWAHIKGERYCVSCFNYMMRLHNERIEPTQKDKEYWVALRKQYNLD